MALPVPLIMDEAGAHEIKSVDASTVYSRPTTEDQLMVGWSG